MTAPLEPARSITDVSKNSSAITEMLNVLLAEILAAAQQLNVQPLDIVTELETRLRG